MIKLNLNQLQKEYGNIIIDSHMHIDKPSRFYPGSVAIAQIIESMDCNCIACGCISSFFSIGSKPMEGNKSVLRCINHYPNRFWGMFSIQPGYSNELPEIFNFIMEQQCFVGAKAHISMHGDYVLSKDYCKLYEFCIEHHYPILVHTFTRDHINQYELVVKEYPELPLIIGHTGGGPDAHYEAIRLCNKYSNVYLDYCRARNMAGFLEFLISECDYQKIFWGSDSCIHSQSYSLGDVFCADINEKIRQAILGYNYLKLLSRMEKIDICPKNYL